MKYEPALPRDDVNVSHRKPLREFCALLAGLLLLALLVFWLLGMLVDVAVDHLSPEAADRVHQVFAKATPADDQPLPGQDRLQALVDRLAPCAGLRTRATVRLVKSDTPNAVVFQGGRMLVFTGLVKEMRSENGLAFVLAHELGHIANRDHLRGMGRAVVLVALSSMLTGDGAALSGILQPTLATGAAGFSRERETLADAAALRTLQCRYGHVGGATELFEVLQKKQSRAPALLHYMESHPQLAARIAYLRRLSAQRGYRSAATLPLPASGAASRAPK